MRLLALDLDDTLAAANCRATEATLARLRDVDALGWRLMLLSGKPTAYLAGFARQLGVGSPVLAGENGAVIAATADFPPAWEYVVELAADSRQWLDHLSDEVSRDFGDSVWLQPNRVNLSVFWRGPQTRDLVIAAVDSHMADYGTEAGFRSFVHGDCSEIVAPGADKGCALTFVLDRLGISPSDVVAIGDSANDLPMFEVAGLSIGIGMPGCDREFADIDRALGWLLEENR